MKLTRLLFVGALIVAGLAGAVLRPGGATSQSVGNNVLNKAVNVEEGLARSDGLRANVSGGAVNAALEATGYFQRRAEHSNNGGTSSGVSSAGTQGCQNGFTRHGSVDNIRVNQDCSLRRQAEEVVVANPKNTKNLIAGQNDSRIGFNHCGYDWSFDSGKTWGDQIPPFYQFVMADGHTADACSDPTATFDSKGNAYVGGVLFDVGSAASAFVVAKSNAGIGGAFYHSPAPGPFQTYNDTPLGVIASDNDPNVFNDKEFIVADSSSSSPKADNVYATWTRFDTSGCPGNPCHSPIYFSQSTDGGATWSPGVEISGSNATNCTAFSGEADPNACDQDQGSHPIVGRDGTVYVAFGNGNTPTLGVNQHMIVKCAASKDCSSPASWSAPVKMGDDYGTQPFGPVGSTACPAGRQCLPPNGYRMDDFVEGSISVDNSGNLYSVWADFRNGGSNCNPLGPAAAATPPCDNDVFMAVSTDGGATWGPTINVTLASKFGPSAQWMPWSAVTPDGKKLYIAYYDRSYGNCETTGCNDITMATVSKPASSSRSLKYTRITTSSMPNLIVANNPVEAGFLGDYMWVSTDKNGNPLITWADTRGLGGTVEEDIYLATP